MSEETPLDAPETGDLPHFSRLNSLTEKVNDVTDRTKKLLMSQKTATPATKKTLDGVLIDRRLTEPTGVLHKAKMIGSLSVKFHKGDRMAMDAMRDLQVMAKSSERHKARILLRISVQGIHILEAGTMKQIDIHDIDKISYLAEDPDNKKVFCYIYNKQLLNKENGKSTTVHRLYAVKSPKSEVIVAHMKGVFHYMYDMRMADSKPSSSNVDMAAAKKEVEETKDFPPLAPSDDENDTLGFDYGKLVELGEPEDLIKPVVSSRGSVSSLQDDASNLYSTGPGGNKIELQEEDEDAMYSTVRKIREEPAVEASAPTQRPPRIHVTSEIGIINPSWDKSQPGNSFDEDVFSLDKYNRATSSSSDSSDEEHTFGVLAQSPTPIPSAVFADQQDYEWDMNAKRYSEGHIELSESRERLSTLTKQAVASLERVREERKNSLPLPSASLIDFATFEDRMETSNALELFDTLKEKPDSNQHDELLSIDFSGPSTQLHDHKQATVQPSLDTERYNIDISTLMEDPNTYKGQGPASVSNPPWVDFPGRSGPAQMGMLPQMGMAPLSSIPPAMGMPLGTSPSASGTTTPNYQPVQDFPVNFGAPEMSQPKPTVNPFHAPKTTSTPSSFDPFSDLMNDVI